MHTGRRFIALEIRFITRTLGVAKEPARFEMTTMKKMLAAFVAALVLAAQTNSSEAPQFTPDGQLVLPKDYREWVYLSSGLGITYEPAAQADQGNPIFDNVFVNRAPYKAFV